MGFMGVRKEKKIWTEEEFRERYFLYKPLLFRIAFSYLGNCEDCEDVLQEAFLKLYYDLPQMGDEEEKRWMIRVTVNLCKNCLKSFWRRKRVSEEEFEKTLETLDAGWTLEEKRALFELVSMTGNAKEVFVLYYQGYRIREIAQILSISESAVKMRLKRGREKLKLELEEWKLV